MRDTHIVVYATHSYGMFDQLINNDFNIEINVLGWGTKWNGYMDKSKALQNFCKNKSKMRFSAIVVK